MTSSSEVDTEVIPPGSGGDEGEAPPQLFLHVSLREADETLRSASIYLDVEAGNVAIAMALARCVRGVAAMRGPGLVAAVDDQLK